MENPDFPKTNLVPALPVSTIYQKLLALGFSQRDVTALSHHTEFPTIPFRSHQLLFFHDYARDVLNHPIDTKDLAVVFEFNERTARKILSRGPQVPGPLGRHRALNAEIEASLVAMLLEAFQSGKAMTRKEFLLTVRERYDPELTKGWVNTFIGRHLDQLQTCRSLPQEEMRMLVPRVYLEEHIRTLHAHVAGKFAELVFNLDELGSADWEDRKIKKVIASSSVRKEDVFHAVSRRHRHTTLLACLSAAGDSLTPMIVTASAIRPSLWARGLRQDEDAMTRHRTPAYVDEELFAEYLFTVFIPYVTCVRNRPELENEPAVLLMDSALPHTSDRVKRILGENNIIAITFPAHTTNLFQALDLVFFGALKKLKPSARGEIGDESVEGAITKLLQAYEQTATSATIRGSFRKAGLEANVTTRPFRIRVSEQKLRENPGFQELWARDIQVEELSRRRQMQRFGVINSEFLPA
jgi:hypothetical protein